MFSMIGTELGGKCCSTKNPQLLSNSTLSCVLKTCLVSAEVILSIGAALLILRVGGLMTSSFLASPVVHAFACVAPVTPELLFVTLFCGKKISQNRLDQQKSEQPEENLSSSNIPQDRKKIKKSLKNEAKEEQTKEELNQEKEASVQARQKSLEQLREEVIQAKKASAQERQKLLDKIKEEIKKTEEEIQQTKEEAEKRNNARSEEDQKQLDLMLQELIDEKQKEIEDKSKQIPLKSEVSKKDTCKYDNQVILNLGRGISQKRLTEKYEKKYGLVSKTIDLKDPVSSKDDLKNLTHNSRVYLIGHIKKEKELYVLSDSAELNKGKAYSIAQLVDYFKMSNHLVQKDPNGRKLTISLVGCSNKKPIDSFAASLSQALDAAKIPAIVYERTRNVSVNESGQKMITTESSDGEKEQVHQPRGWKRKFETNEGELSFTYVTQKAAATPPSIQGGHTNQIEDKQDQIEDKQDQVEFNRQRTSSLPKAKPHSENPYQPMEEMIKYNRSTASAPQTVDPKYAFLLNSPKFVGFLSSEQAKILLKSEEVVGHPWLLRYCEEKSDFCLNYYDTDKKEQREEYIRDIMKEVGPPPDGCSEGGFWVAISLRVSSITSEKNILYYPLATTSLLSGSTITRKDAEMELEDRPLYSWMVRKSSTQKNRVVVSVKAGEGIYDHWISSDKTELKNITMHSLLQRCGLKASNFVLYKPIYVKEHKFKYKNKNVDVWKESHGAIIARLIARPNSEMCIKFNSRGEYFIYYKGDDNTLFVLPIPQSELRLKDQPKCKDLAIKYLDDFVEENLVTKKLGKLLPPEEVVLEELPPITPNTSKYDYQVILNLGRGNAQNGLAAKNKANHGLESAKVNLTSVKWQSPVALGKLSYKSRLYIIGHCNEGQDYISSDWGDKLTVEQFVAMIQEHAFKLREFSAKSSGAKLTVSVVACYGASPGHQGEQSFAERLSKALDRVKIPAIVYGRTGPLKRLDDSHDPKLYKKWVKNSSGMFVHKIPGTKRAFTTEGDISTVKDFVWIQK